MRALSLAELSDLELDRRCRQRLADRAAGLGLLGEFFERLFIDARDLAFGLQDDLGDLEALADLVERDVGGGVHAPGLVPGLAEPGRQGHRETGGMRRADELFGIGAGGVLEARAERIAALERAALAGIISVSAFEIAGPGCFCVTSGHGPSPWFFQER